MLSYSTLYYLEIPLGMTFSPPTVIKDNDFLSLMTEDNALKLVQYREYLCFRKLKGSFHFSISIIVPYHSDVSHILFGLRD